MKTARNLTIALGVLLLLYVGSYCLFARDGMRSGYLNWGYSYSSVTKWGDWRKLFVPIATVDSWVNIERPFRKLSVGHWQAADSDDFVTFARDGECSFRIGEFEHARKAEMDLSECYRIKFVRDGNSFHFGFGLDGDSGQASATVWGEVEDAETGRYIAIEVAHITLTLTDAPD